MYKKYEPDPGRFLATFVLLGIMPSLSVPFMATHFSSLSTATVVSFSLFYATLLSSIFLYRISPFHPLARYPGPFLAKVSKFWNVWVMVTGEEPPPLQGAPCAIKAVCTNRYVLPFHAVPLHTFESALAIKCSCIYIIIDTLHHLCPNELSVTDVTSISSILGASGMQKGLSTFHHSSILH